MAWVELLSNFMSVMVKLESKFDCMFVKLYLRGILGDLFGGGVCFYILRGEFVRKGAGGMIELPMFCLSSYMDIYGGELWWGLSCCFYVIA